MLLVDLYCIYTTVSLLTHQSQKDPPIQAWRDYLTGPTKEGKKEIHNLKQKRDRKKWFVPWHFVLQVHFSLEFSALPIYWKHYETMLHDNIHKNLSQFYNNISKANVQENCTLCP